MNIKPIAILAACAFFTGGCGKSPTSPTANSSDSQPTPAIQSEPFHGQVYKSLDGRTVLTFVSKDECELAERGTILLCKYSKPNNTLRIVTTASGTTQVIYFRFTDQGLDDNNGNVLLSPERYPAAFEQLQQQQRQRLEEQLAKERKQLEEQRKADIIASSQREARAKEREAFAAGVSQPQLKLTGIAGGVRPIATINNITFAVGEEQEVKVEGGKLRIRLLEIHEKSVVISVEKQPQPIELKVRDVSVNFDE